MIAIHETELVCNALKELVCIYMYMIVHDVIVDVRWVVISDVVPSTAKYITGRLHYVCACGAMAVHGLLLQGCCSVGLHWCSCT